MTGHLPTYGPTEIQHDEDTTPAVIVRVAYAMSREQLLTALSIGFTEIAPDREADDLTVEEVRSEVEGCLAAAGIIELDRSVTQGRLTACPPEQRPVRDALAAAVDRAYPPAPAPAFQREAAGADVTACPAWCLGAHEPGGARADIIHSGPDVDLTFHGAELFTACLVQSPYATSTNPEFGGRTPGVSVYPPGRNLTPVHLYSLAAALDGYADQLRDLADQLTTVLAGGEVR